jgi:hypothetical protein
MSETNFKVGDIVRSVYGHVFMINKLTKIEGFQGSVSFEAGLLSVKDGKFTDNLDTSELELIIRKTETLSDKPKKDMSIREYYAGQAFSCLMANENNRAAYDPKSCASECIKYADALIEELGE